MDCREKMVSHCKGYQSWSRKLCCECVLRDTILKTNILSEDVSKRNCFPIQKNFTHFLLATKIVSYFNFPSNFQSNLQYGVLTAFYKYLLEIASPKGTQYSNFSLIKDKSFFFLNIKIENCHI